MKDDNKAGDQEYQYPEGEYVVEGEAQEPTAGLPPPNANLLADLWRANKRIIIITLIAVFLALMFKIFTGGKPKEMAAPVAVVPAQATVIETPTMPMQQIDDVQNALSEGSQNKAAIDQLRNEVQQLKSAVDSINSAQAQFSNTLGVLSDQINQIQTSLQPKPVIKKAGPVIVPINYYLRAIVPGRAWIQGTDSSSRSVAVGDNVKQYGVVQNIDAEAGVVTTSSGKLIIFNSDDS